MGKYKKSPRAFPMCGRACRKRNCGAGRLLDLSVIADTTKPEKLVTAESVRAGHPDKLCDQIADAILDAHLADDPNARVAVEVMATAGKITVAGEVTSESFVNYHQVIYEQLAKIGYGICDLCDDPAQSLELEIRVHEQSADIAEAVRRKREVKADIGAGDQGIMVGYATDETSEYMPLPVVLAQKICKALDSAICSAPWLLTDGKAQVTVLYQGDRPVAVTDVVVSVQHTTGFDVEKIRAFITSEVLKKVIPSRYWTETTKVQINPSGRFLRGGPAADTGLTGRKLAVDAYGPVAHIGGGAMSGKDSTKVDRTGAYAARWMAKNIVAAGLARKCEVQVAYAIGKAKPVSISVETFGTGKVSDELLAKAVKKVFDLRPGVLIEQLHLRNVKYAPLAAYGHFGRDELDLPWEKTDRIELLLHAVELLCGYRPNTRSVRRSRLERCGKGVLQ